MVKKKNNGVIGKLPLCNKTLCGVLVLKNNQQYLASHQPVTVYFPVSLLIYLCAYLCLCALCLIMTNSNNINLKKCEKDQYMFLSLLLF